MNIPTADGTYWFNQETNTFVPNEANSGYYVAYDALPETIDHGQLVGVWTNPETKEQDVELTSWWDDLKEALEFGRENNQLAIWDIEAGEEVWV